MSILQKPVDTSDEKGNKVRILGTMPFKLKDYPQNRSFKFIHLKDMFGVVPETIAVAKVPGENNKFVVKAFVPGEKKKLEVPEKKMIK